MPENSTHKCTNAVNNVQPIRNSSHVAKILSVYNGLQAGDYENGNGGKRRASRLTQVYLRNASTDRPCVVICFQSDQFTMSFQHGTDDACFMHILFS